MENPLKAECVAIYNSSKELIHYEKDYDDEIMFVLFLDDGYEWSKGNWIHRGDNRPACWRPVYNCLEWMVDGKFHRTDGPAIIYTDRVDDAYFYYLNDKKYTREEFVAFYEITYLKEYTGL